MTQRAAWGGISGFLRLCVLLAPLPRAALRIYYGERTQIAAVQSTWPVCLVFCLLGPLAQSTSASGRPSCDSEVVNASSGGGPSSAEAAAAAAAAADGASSGRRAWLGFGFGFGFGLGLGLGRRVLWPSSLRGRVFRLLDELDAAPRLQQVRVRVRSRSGGGRGGGLGAGLGFRVRAGAAAPS